MKATKKRNWGREYTSTPEEPSLIEGVRCSGEIYSGRNLGVRRKFYTSNVNSMGAHYLKKSRRKNEKTQREMEESKREMHKEIVEVEKESHKISRENLKLQRERLVTRQKENYQASERARRDLEIRLNKKQGRGFAWTVLGLTALVVIGAAKFASKIDSWGTANYSSIGKAPVRTKPYMPQVIIANDAFTSLSPYTHESAVRSIIHAEAFYEGIVENMRTQGFTEQQIKDNVKLLLDTRGIDIYESKLYEELSKGPYAGVLPKRSDGIEGKVVSPPEFDEIWKVVSDSSLEAGANKQELVYLGNGGINRNLMGVPDQNRYIEFGAQMFPPSEFSTKLNRGEPYYPVLKNSEADVVFTDAANSDFASFLMPPYQRIRDYFGAKFDPKSDDVLKFVKALKVGPRKTVWELLKDTKAELYATNRKGHRVNAQDSIYANSTFMPKAEANN